METKVKIFNRKIILDKLLIISLDGNFKPDKFYNEKWKEIVFPNGSFNCKFAFNYEDGYKLIRRKENIIFTTITKFLDVLVMKEGYEIIVTYKDNYISFSDLFSSEKIKENQNWEEILYSGFFTLDIPRLEIK